MVREALHGHPAGLPRPEGLADRHAHVRELRRLRSRELRGDLAAVPGRAGAQPGGHQAPRGSLLELPILPRIRCGKRGLQQGGQAGAHVLLPAGLRHCPPPGPVRARRVLRDFLPLAVPLGQLRAGPGGRARILWLGLRHTHRGPAREPAARAEGRGPGALARPRRRVVPGRQRPPDVELGAPEAGRLLRPLRAHAAAGLGDA
mmetsp:Transcript_87653/g.272406  ORF Transcript_87653/g.272406 Transcript_87653/m.272406 type:complete len:203 (+) Transcript_87653:1151-1759(+)